MVVASLTLLLAAPAHAEAGPLDCDQVETLVRAGFTDEAVARIIRAHQVQATTAACLHERKLSDRVVTIALANERAPAAVLPTAPPPRSYPVTTAFAYLGTGMVVGGTITAVAAANRADNLNVALGGGFVAFFGVVSFAVAGVSALVEYQRAYERRRWVLTPQGLTLRF